MLLSYLKLSFRLLARNPFFTAINVAGLSVGFAVFFVLWQYASYELKSERFHKDHDRIFRLYGDFYANTGIEWVHYVFGVFPPAFTKIAHEKFTEIESTTRIIHQQNFDEVRWSGPQTDSGAWNELKRNVLFSVKDNFDEKYFQEEKVAYADPNLFEFFSIPLIEGKPAHVLNLADAIVLSQATAKKYFGLEHPIGKVITMNDTSHFTVTGVFEDLPRNTHLNFELVMSTLRIENAISKIHPFQRSTHNYFKVKPGTDVTSLGKKLNDEHKQYWDWKEWPGAILTVILQPLAEIPFTVFDNDAFTPKSKTLLKAFRLVGIIVLIMAWINYLNLKMASQLTRMKELAARRTVGARKTDFIKQFIMESLVINLTAVLIAFTIIQLVRQPLKSLFEFYLPNWSTISLSSLLVFSFTMAIWILIAGLHPAIVSWRMTAKEIMSRLAIKRKRFTQATSIIQFVIAIALTVWFFSISDQINFLIKDNWGLQRDQVIVVDLPVETSNQKVEISSLKNELLRIEGVEDVTLSTIVAGDLSENVIGFTRKDSSVFVAPKSDGGVDERFVPFYGLKILAGRNFLLDNPADHHAVILSRLAAQSAGWKPEQALGQTVLVEKYSWRPFQTEAVVIGVVEDHRHTPMYRESVFTKANMGNILTYQDYLRESNKPAKLSVRLIERWGSKTIPKMEKLFGQLFPGDLFHWYFLDEHMNVHYKSEASARNQITLFTLIAIGIACLGLLGMISNKVIEKTKEIGIRKVLGAQLHQIAQILLSTTFRQIIIATIIGIPVAYYLTQQYLQKFSERIELQWWHFALPVLILVLIMLGTVAAVVLKAAKSNPVEALKYE
jgi:putative ABC transport system permease protein